MPTMTQDVEDAVHRVETEVRAVAKRLNYGDVKLKPYPPASDTTLATYEQYLQLRLSNSYRTFLKLHDGYDYLAYPGHMLPIASVMPGGNWYDEIREWKKMAADYGGGEVLDGVVIANLGQENNWAYLDPNKPSGKDELTVSIWLSGDSEDFPTLIEFFEWCISVCRQDLPPP